MVGLGALGSLPRGPLGRLRRGPRERRWCRKPEITRPMPTRNTRAPPTMRGPAIGVALSSGQSSSTCVGAELSPSEAISTEMSSGTSMVVVSVRSAVNSSSHRSEPTGEAAASAAGSGAASAAPGVGVGVGVAGVVSVGTVGNGSSTGATVDDLARELFGLGVVGHRLVRASHRAMLRRRHCVRRR